MSFSLRRRAKIHIAPWSPQGSMLITLGTNLGTFWCNLVHILATVGRICVLVIIIVVVIVVVEMLNILREQPTPPQETGFRQKCC